MRIGIDGRPLQTGYRHHQGRGIGLYTVELVRALAGRPELRLVVFLDPRYPTAEERIPAGAERRPFPRAPGGIRLHDRVVTQFVAPFVRRRDLDLFHFPSHMDAPLFMPGRTVVTVHDLILELMGDRYARGRPLRYRAARALDRGIIARARAIVTDSEHSKRDIVSRLGLAPGRIHVAPLGVAARFRPASDDQVARLRERLGLPPRFALYLGGCDARKNLVGLLEAYAQLDSALRAATPLVLAGPLSNEPEFPGLLERAHALGVRGSLQATGYVEDADLPALLSAASVFVFPSLYEGFGLPPLEAMACGTPVVSTDGGSLKEVLGDSACMVPAGDVEAFARALRGVLEDPALQERLRLSGRARAAEFTWEVTARRTSDAYARAIGLGSSRPS